MKRILLVMVTGQLIALAFNLLIAPAALAAGYTFTTIDYPGYAGTTQLSKIDNRGRILGEYGPGVFGSGPIYGFLLDHGSFTSINFPGATQTFPTDITPFDEVVGEINQFSDGFILQGGVYTQFDAPGNAGTTELDGINNRRQIVGFTYANNAPYYTSFLLDGGVLTTLPQYPGSVGTLAERISANGDILGEWVPPFTGSFVASPFHGFLLSGGTFTDLESPLQGTSNCDTANSFGFEYCTTGPSDLNTHGDVVGAYSANDGSVHGFLFSKGVWTTVDVPGATATLCLSINDSGQIVGVYYDSAGIEHGFAADPH